MEHTEASIRKIFIKSISWLVLAYIIASFAALLPPLPIDETQQSWFQRSGSIVVILSVWVEFKLFDIKSYFDKSAYSVPFELSNSYHFAYKTISIITVFTAISGTVIWGYGDLLL